MTNASTKHNARKRILVTGGAGEMGAYACRVLAKADEVEEVLVADRDQEKATKLAGELGPKATPLTLDISDADALTDALTDVDIVLNTAGPFYRFGREVLSAAIATGTDYLDICDDWEPTLEMLALDDAAREAGVTAVIGMGASPGTSNLLAVLAMDECDTVDTIYTSWRASAAHFPRAAEGKEFADATAAIEHWVHNCTEPIKFWRDGGLIDGYGLEETTLTYPGVGTDPVWVCGHPEPLTLPRVRPEVRESLNVMSARRGLMDAIAAIAQRVRAGELDVRQASEELLRQPNLSGRNAGPSPALPSNIFAVAEGTKNNRRVRVGAQATVQPEGNMGEMTGIPLAVAALMAARGQVVKPGVHGPEGAIDPKIFFHDLAQYAPQPPVEGQEVYEVVSEFID
ncbi:saccharopine dehydrogenase [Streptacidiphilus pinicola]|uniref:Saccharopine dehydrogenase n=1 Tax=Streptacidiphilus pinicola TaxID=2219663 RepID=A0A2X0ID17_9ACTN|nr:SDR family NAD(P)-dependent oxidoreductase [Streptacidiphilus pinicola]RAG82407.1 saccharopine dehydrogenase [Streptacidiphilus pinicola]